MGGLSIALARLQANRPLRELREIAKGVTKQLPEAFQVLPMAEMQASSTRLQKYQPGPRVYWPAQLQLACTC